MKRFLTLSLLLLAGCGTPAPQHSAATDAASTAAAPNTADLDAILKAAVEQRRVPHAAAMVATKDVVVYEGAEGVPGDAIYSIASMTKPVTAVAVMQLVEAGKVKLDEPAATYVPDLATVMVLDAGKMRPPKSAPTVRQLLSHTAGFGYEFLNAELFDLVGEKQVPSMAAGGDGFLRAPLLFDPGVRWEYGINFDWLGRLVERVSGQSLEAYFRDHIFGPLRMMDTSFHVPPDKEARVAKSFQRAKDGSLAEAPRMLPKPGMPAFGGGGLYSTAHDYLTFARAIMNGGQAGLVRILTPESVAMMGQNQIGALRLRPFRSLVPALATDNVSLHGDGDTFGFGVALNSQPSSTGRGVNTMSWVGINNTFFWVDRERQIAAVLLTQMLPGLDPGPAKLLEDFDRAVYARPDGASAGR
jgi:CubicO group peptidase (beta-lactamase class C family)